ncbi:MAG: hypothetical protein U0791_04325 [Gemmataceae bacterium]
MNGLGLSSVEASEVLCVVFEASFPLLEEFPPSAALDMILVDTAAVVGKQVNADGLRSAGAVPFEDS